MDKVKTIIPPPVPLRRRKRKPPPPIPKFTGTINKSYGNATIFESQSNFNQIIPCNFNKNEYSTFNNKLNQLNHKEEFEIDDGKKNQLNSFKKTDETNKDIDKKKPEFKLYNNKEVNLSSEKQIKNNKLKKYPPILFTAQDFKDVIASSQVNDKKILTFLNETNEPELFDNAQANFLTEKYKELTLQSRTFEFRPKEKKQLLKNSSDFTKIPDNKDISDKNHSCKNIENYLLSSSIYTSATLTSLNDVEEKTVTLNKYSAKSLENSTIISDLKENDKNDNVKVIKKTYGNKNIVLTELLNNFKTIKLKAIPMNILTDSEEKRMEDTRLEYLMIKDKESQIVTDNKNNKHFSLNDNNNNDNNDNNACSKLLGIKTDVSEDLIIDINDITSLNYIENSNSTESELKEITVSNVISSIQLAENYIAPVNNNNNSDDKIYKNNNINVNNENNNDKDNNFTIFDQTSYAIPTTSIGSIFVNSKIKPIENVKLNGKFDFSDCTRTNKFIEKYDFNFEISSIKNKIDDLNDHKLTGCKSNDYKMDNELEVNCELNNKLKGAGKTVHSKNQIFPPAAINKTAEKQGTNNFSKSTELYSPIPVFILRM